MNMIKRRKKEKNGFEPTITYTHQTPFKKTHESH